MEKIRFGTYIPADMKEQLDVLSERSKIKIAPLVEEAIGDLLEKPHYKELLEDKKEAITNVSMKMGWLCLSNERNKVYLKTFSLTNGCFATITIDNFTETPITIQNYALDDNLDLNSWENIFSEPIETFPSLGKGLNQLKKILNEEDLHSVKRLAEQE